MGGLLSTLLLIIFTTIAGIGLKGDLNIPGWLKKLTLGLGIAALIIKAIEFISSFFMGKPWPTGGVIAWLFGPDGPWTTPGGLTWTVILPILIAGGIGATVFVIALKSKLAGKLMAAYSVLSFAYALLGIIFFDYNYLDTIGSAFTS